MAELNWIVGYPTGVGDAVVGKPHVSGVRSPAGVSRRTNKFFLSYDFTDEARKLVPLRTVATQVGGEGGSHRGPFHQVSSAP